MDWQTTPFVFPILFGTALSALLCAVGLVSLRRDGWRPSVGAFVVLSAAVVVWTAAAAVELLSPDPAIKLFAYKVLPTGASAAPPAWWVTVNAWVVDVRGGYDRFAVRAGTGAASGPGGSLTYVRDGGAATVDYDGDGAAERLGHADRISFETRTGVVLAVPPGPQGVGDKGGNVDARSTRWTDWQPVEPSQDRGPAGAGT